MAKYYPINLNLENRKCTVVGGGKVAERKVIRLLECGAGVEVIAPKATETLRKLAAKRRITYKCRHVNLRDINDAFLVISATGNRRINNLVSLYCQENRILVNVVDSPEECNFILPSVVKRGDLTLAISTQGVSPALSKKIRVELEKRFGPEYARLLNLMKKMRPKALKIIKSQGLRKKFFSRATGRKVLNLLKKNKLKDAKGYLERILRGI